MMSNGVTRLAMHSPPLSKGKLDRLSNPGSSTKLSELHNKFNKN